MLHKKLHIPINIPLSTDFKIESSEFDYEIIKKIQKFDSLSQTNIKDFFKDYFKDKLSKVISNNFYFFWDRIIPIILKSKYHKEGIYQLFRFSNEILYNFSYIETLTKSTFIYENLSRIFLFSGYLTNILAKDEKLLDILQPEYAMRLNGNITFYKNSFDRMNVSVKDEEILLNSLRKNHRLLKFQILFALINDEINIKRASNELSLLAQATLDISLKIIHAQISAKYKVENLKYSIIAYGRFATSTMTANSDLDLVFIYDDENGDKKASRKIYVELFRQIIKFLSVKTEEGLMYEVDTKLKPSGKGGPVACTYENFKEYHEKSSYSWEKIALKKTRVVNENIFNHKIINLLNKLKSLPIYQNKVAYEISLMRTDNNSNKDLVQKETLKWFETKYAGGGQRDIEYLNFFNEKNSILISQDEIQKKFMLISRMQDLYFYLDQIMNICFEEKKQDHLPSKAVNMLIKETNEKDLGTLKATVKLGRKELYSFLNEIVESQKISSSHQ
jgi:glutamine synthetase adenylyltransferase